MADTDTDSIPEATPSRPAQSQHRAVTDKILILLGCLIVIAAQQIITLRKRGFYDFDLHYFAGLIERTGSYTDSARLFHVIVSEGFPRPLEGIYGTPTLIGLIFQPLSFLPLTNARQVWVLLCALALTLSVRKAVGGRYWLAWLAAVAFSPALMLGLQLGNVSVITNAALIYAYGCARAQQSARLGAVIGFAFALKLYPGFLLLPLLAKRNWLALKWAALTTCALLLATVPALGFDDAVRGFKATFELGGYVHESLDNIGWPGAIRQLTGDGELARRASYVTLLTGIGLVWFNRRRRLDDLLALAIVTMLLVQSIAWRHYAPALIVAVIALSQRELTRMTRVNVGFVYLLAIGWIGAAIARTFAVTNIVAACYTFGATCLLALLAVHLQTRVDKQTG